MPSTADKAKAYDKLIQETPSVDTSTSKAKAEFREGMKDEAEHSDDPKIKEKLVKDHMAKYKDSPVGYYEALEKLEDTLQGLKKTASAKPTPKPLFKPVDDLPEFGNDFQIVPDGTKRLYKITVPEHKVMFAQEP